MIRNIRRYLIVALFSIAVVDEDLRRDGAGDLAEKRW